MLKRVLAATLVVASLGLGPTEASAQACMSLGEARQAVQNGLALPLRQLRGLLGGGLLGGLFGGGGQVVSVQLCRVGDKLVYSIGVLGNRGEVKRFHFDARNGSRWGDREP